MSIQARRLAVISRVYQEWSLERDRPTSHDPALMAAGEHGDADGLDLLAADVDDHDDLERRTRAALEAEGFNRFRARRLAELARDQSKRSNHPGQRESRSAPRAAALSRDRLADLRR